MDMNLVVGLAMSWIAWFAWALVVILDAKRSPTAPVMLLLATGMLLVSTLAVADQSWWVAVFAAANRAIVAAAGLRALWQVTLARRGARRER